MTSTFLYGAHVAANSIRQHYLRYGGHGRRLVIVPGITSPAVTWGFVAERFGRTFDTYVLDVRGRGLSSAESDLDFGLDACAADVTAFVSALALDSVLLLGHSMGGRITVRSARDPDCSVRRLVLVDPPVSGPGRRAYPSPLSWYLDSIRLATRGVSVDELRSYLPDWSNAHLQIRAEWLHTCSERAVTVAHQGFHEDDIHRDLPHIQVPTLVVAAERGDVIQPEELAELERLLPNARSVRVKEAGHMIPWDNLDGFCAAVIPFLNTGA